MTNPAAAARWRRIVDDYRERMARLDRTIASLEDENHALREELRETQRDLADANLLLSEARQIINLLPPIGAS